MMRLSIFAAISVLAGCASGLEKASEPIHNQSFSIANSNNTISCTGYYTRSSLQNEVIVPVTCQNGTQGKIAIRTAPNGHPTLATVSISDGTTARIKFRDILGDRHAYGDIVSVTKTNTSSASLTKKSKTISSSVRSSRTSSSYNNYYLGPRGGCYYINSNGNKTYVDRSYCR